jgi:hypothetical protein
VAWAKQTRNLIKIEVILILSRKKVSRDFRLYKIQSKKVIKKE